MWLWVTLWYLNETRSELIKSGWPFIYLRPALEVSLSLSSRENIIDNLLKFTEHWNRIPRPTSTSSSPLLWPLSWAIYRHLSLWHVWRPFQFITCTTLSILPPVSAASAAYLLNSITDSTTTYSIHWPSVRVIHSADRMARNINFRCPNSLSPTHPLLAAAGRPAVHPWSSFNFQWMHVIETLFENMSLKVVASSFDI